MITLLIPYISVIFASKSDKKNISEYLKIPKTYKELMKGKTFNGEIVFFAVSQNCRGLGIGRQLTDDVKHYFKEMSAYAVSVFTDTNCNYGFYDSQGFGLVESKEIELNIVPSPKNLTIFLYALNVVTTTQ